MDDDQYGTADLRRYYIGGMPFVSRPPELLSGHWGSTSSLSHYPHDMVMYNPSDSTIVLPQACLAKTSSAAGGGLSTLDGGDCGNGRWPRQETLTLLEIRSSLDPKFKAANQKAPLWDEVSRIMCEEHGYQRSGKKCREKFENLYKYYKKTKEKQGRRDGRHYRFFRQLEALCGDQTRNSTSLMPETTHFPHDASFQLINFPGNDNISIDDNNDQEINVGPKISDSTTFISLSNSYDNSDTITSSHDMISDFKVGRFANSYDPEEKKRRGKRSLKTKIRDSIDEQMRNLTEKQEAWMEKMMRTIKEKEIERVLREEQWRKQEVERAERERKFWASERAWIQSRDAALMDSFRKSTGKEMELIIGNLNENKKDDIWRECDQIKRLNQLRSGMESEFQQGGVSEEMIWDSVNNYLLKCTKKVKGDPGNCQNHYQSICNQVEMAHYWETSKPGIDHHPIRINEHQNSPPSSSVSEAISDSCFRYLIGDTYGRIVN